MQSNPYKNETNSFHFAVSYFHCTSTYKSFHFSRPLVQPRCIVLNIAVGSGTLTVHAHVVCSKRKFDFPAIIVGCGSVLHLDDAFGEACAVARKTTTDNRVFYPDCQPVVRPIVSTGTGCTFLSCGIHVLDPRQIIERSHKGAKKPVSSRDWLLRRQRTEHIMPRRRPSSSSTRYQNLGLRWIRCWLRNMSMIQ